MTVFSKDKTIKALLGVSREITALGQSYAVLEWDQETFMPPKAASLRSEQLAAIAGLSHEKLVDKSFGKILGAVKPKNLYDRALVREVKRDYEREVKLPKELVEEISKQTSLATAKWQEAKKQSNFLLFEADLAKLLALKVKAAKLLAKNGQTAYDVMLDDHEPGLSEKETIRIFDELRPKLVVLVQKLSKLTRGAESVLSGHVYDPVKQMEFGVEVISKMGFDFAAGRQDTSAHPFTQPIGSGDVRITTWNDTKSITSPLFSSMHEAGHALYYQGVDPRLDVTPLYGSASLGMSESQSRFWENIVGRSPEFWKYWYPTLQKLLPRQFRSLDVRKFLRAINAVRPSLVRVKADEVTYGLHIILRFDIERMLVGGEIKVGELPKVWNSKIKEYLGLVPKNDREGVLQDIHWAHGSIGYFPTYLLGNLIGAQIWYTIKKKMPEVEKQIAKGELAPLREWLQKNIYQYGKLYETSDLVKRVTGERLSSSYFVRYLEEKFSSIYG